MSRLLSIIVLACFLLISALANFGNVDAYAAPVDVSQTQVSTSEFQKDDCPCEKESGATKLVCGVTLAPAIHSVMVHPPVLPKNHCMIFETTGLDSFMNLQKRPPRTLLQIEFSLV